MSIEYCEELDLEFGLFRAVRLDARLFKVKHDRDSVLVIVANQSIVSVSSIRNHVWHQRLL